MCPALITKPEVTRRSSRIKYGGSRLDYTSPEGWTKSSGTEEEGSSNVERPSDLHDFEEYDEKAAITRLGNDIVMMSTDLDHTDRVNRVIATHDHKRRRIVRDVHHKDDEEGKPEAPEPPPLKLEAPAPGPTNVNGQSDNQGPENGRVKLVVKTPGGSMMMVVTTSTIGKIASLTPWLSMSLSDTIPRQIPRQTIDCNTHSGDEAVIQAIEFLESGTLTPLSREPGASGFLEQSCSRIKVFDISQELDIETLEIAVVEDVQGNSLHDGELLARFAAACYDRVAGHRVEKGSSLGQLVKAGLGRFMPEMIALGIADDLGTAGGQLSEELMEIVWIRHKKLEQLRAARMMAG